jgi:Helicase conserved C-terminal domain
VNDLNELGIKAVALTAEKCAKNPGLWTKVDRGEFQLVYLSPEMLLHPNGHFLNVTVRNPTSNFMKNLCLIAVDECHLIWTWEFFRSEYTHIGEIRDMFWHVPFVCLSATLTPNVAAYVHQVCRLRDRTTQFNLTTRRDNINIAVIPIGNVQYTDRLCDELIPHVPRDLLEIPKTLIFCDNIRIGKAIVDTLRKRLPHHLQGKAPDTVVRSYWASMDEEMKDRALSDIKSGRTRITVCTDAFGMGINIKDITRVIQWGVPTNLTMDSLYQRLGRAARRAELTGDAFIYVPKSILEAVPMEWKDEWKNVEGSTTTNVEAYDDIAVVPVVRERRLGRFGLPVLPETESEVRSHLFSLYREEKSLREAIRNASSRNQKGDKDSPISAPLKMDPAVLWFLCTVGCRHAAVLKIFQDPEVFSDSHRGWCCDSCAWRRGRDGNTMASGVLLKTSISYVRNGDGTQKIILVGKAKQYKPIDPKLQEQRPIVISSQQQDLLKRAMIEWRERMWKGLKLGPFILSSTVLPDKVISHIVQHARRIINIDQLKWQLAKVKYDVDSGVLSSQNLNDLLQLINLVFLQSTTRSMPLNPQILIY